jgi:hypothetical protein
MFMKALSVLLVLFLVGCSNQPTLDELEAEALQTGDWTAVEEREKLLRRTGRLSDSECPSGTLQMCVDDMGSETCRCLPPSATAGKRIN